MRRRSFSSCALSVAGLDCIINGGDGDGSNRMVGYSVWHYDTAGDPESVKTFWEREHPGATLYLAETLRDDLNGNIE